MNKPVAEEFELEGKLIALPKIHNPSQSCFTAYYPKIIAGKELLIYEVSFGICFAEVNPEWVSESKVA